MEQYFPVAVVTLLSGLLLFVMAITVARTHRRTGILAPTMTGHPDLERAVRAHYNTLEWMPIFLPSMWLFAIYWSPVWAAGLGMLWLAGRTPISSATSPPRQGGGRASSSSRSSPSCCFSAHSAVSSISGWHEPGRPRRPHTQPGSFAMPTVSMLWHNLRRHCALTLPDGIDDAGKRRRRTRMDQ